MEIERFVKALQDKGVQLDGLGYKDVHLIAYNSINEKALVSEANAIVEKGGATEVYACATHAVLSGPAIERIKNSALKEVVLLDTIPVPQEKMIDKFTILPVAPTFAEAIARIYNDKPFTAAFGW